jgi:hypothetical protein
MIAVTFPDNVKKYMELQCNSVISDYTECPEFSTVRSILRAVLPNNALDLGAGIGRASVFLRNEYDWADTNFYLLDGNSGNTQIAGLHHSIGKDFYNSLEAAQEFCTTNNIKKENLFLINAENDWELGTTKYDLCYSLKAIGFHWPITSYLERIHKNLSKDAILLLELRSCDSQYYPDPKRVPRIKNFVFSQLDTIDKNKYRTIQLNLLDKFPILVLEAM